MNRRKIRGLLYASYVHFARSGAILVGLDAREI